MKRLDTKLWITTAVLALAFVCPGFVFAEDSVPIEGDETVRARLEHGRDIVLLALPDRGEGYLSIAERLGGSAKFGPDLQIANGGRQPRLGVPIRVPCEMLRSEYRYLAVRALFPNDRPSPEGWLHEAGEATLLNHSESLWQVALWITGNGENWKAIASANRLRGPDLPAGRTVVVPGSLVQPLFRFHARDDSGQLAFDYSNGEPFAQYRLKKGEALYSAVVLRFTGLTESEDVQDAVKRIAEYSGIRNVRDIPVGYPVKVPFELLAREFLPDNEPRQVIARLNRKDMAQIELARRPTSLDGVHVILDPGHGGADIGAQKHGVWESDYVYDIACRLKKLLEGETGASVHMIVEDTEHGCRIFDKQKLTPNKKEVIATSPPHKNKGGSTTRAGVNLRWYLANSIFRDVTKKRGVEPENVVFISLHADSRHASTRGAMIFTPGERYRRGRQGSGGRTSRSYYKKFGEYRQAPVVSFTRKERLRDELLSNTLAEAMLEAYASNGLPVHANRPIRDHVVRGRRRTPQRWLPAVLRGNMVPAKLLFETVNINNKKDAGLLKSPDGRQKMAKAMFDGLKNFYREDMAARRKRPGKSRDG